MQLQENPEYAFTDDEFEEEPDEYLDEEPAEALY
jgi:hypothetical protein